MPGVFINYRRADTQAWALALFDKLAGKFGKDRVFMDLDNLEPGEDFVDKIEETLSLCDAMVVLIGRDWLNVSDREDKPRLQNPDDWVRVEIEAGLKRKIRVIPVLLDGVEMPRSPDLPETLRVLVRKQALEISPTRYHHDVDRLIRPLEKLLDSEQPPASSASAETGPPAKAKTHRAKQPEKPPAKKRRPPSPAPVDAEPPARARTRRAKEPAAGDTRRHAKDGLTYVWIPPGGFLMGATPGDADARDDEKPQHHVGLTRGFWLSQGPVTVAAYKKYVADTGVAMPVPPPSNTRRSMRDHPVVNVDWDDAVAYCVWAGGRLPTEAEWEYAARGGKANLVYPLGNRINPKSANYRDSGWEGTSKVGSYPPNHFALHDMSGNVWEWTADWYQKTYYSRLSRAQAGTNPQGPKRGSHRIVRGGSWLHSSVGLRTASRGSYAPASSDSRLGFRCLREVFP
jgi:formylglycine-generating enzyme required for sulfatase activity